MTKPPKAKHNFGHDFRTFFVRGLAIVLPTALTIWLLSIAYGFVNDNIAGPINAGVRAALMSYSNWPVPTDIDFVDVYPTLSPSQKDAWDLIAKPKVAEDLGIRLEQLTGNLERTRRIAWMQTQPGMVYEARLHAFEKKWDGVQVGNFRVLNLIGLVLAVMLIYIIGILVTSFIGRSLYRWGEGMITRVPLIRNVYPAVKQVTDLFFSGTDEDVEDTLNFSRVVAVQYPRMGIWSVGLVTGDTMQTIENQAGHRCMTVFIPSSPTPFTGYVITVPKSDTIDLPVSVEEALKFIVSGGVVVPLSEVIGRATGPSALPAHADAQAVAAGEAASPPRP